MKKILLALCMTTVAVEAHAISRYSVTDMSCRSVQRAVQRDGAAILRWSSNRVQGLPRYGRYVSDDRFCRIDENAVRAYVPSADRQSCPVYECKTVDPEDDFFWLKRRRF